MHKITITKPSQEDSIAHCTVPCNIVLNRFYNAIKAYCATGFKNATETEIPRFKYCFRDFPTLNSRLSKGRFSCTYKFNSLSELHYMVMTAFSIYEIRAVSAALITFTSFNSCNKKALSEMQISRTIHQRMTK